MQLYIDSRYTSPYAMSAYVALLEKGLDFEVVKLVLAAGEQHAADYAARSLTARVPTLVDGDFALSESSAIAEYLEDLYPARPPLYPATHASRARARQVQAWLRSDLLPIREERSTEVLFYGARGAPLSDAARAAAAKLFAAAGALLAHGGEHLFECWSIADVDLCVMLNRLCMHGDPVPATLAAYAARQWLRPSVQRWVTQARPPRA